MPLRYTKAVDKCAMLQYLRHSKRNTSYHRPLCCCAAWRGDKRNPVRIRSLPRSCICSCAALRRKAAIVGGAHEKVGSRAGRFWQVLCRARLHEPEDLVMRGRLRTQIGHGNNGRGRTRFCHGPFAPCVRNRGALVRHAFPFEKHGALVRHAFP